ncbi:hypothetical protein QIS99_00465 [Streptomyces sp. B-S-A8]|uniref:Uncharacterized protein n=1 Tax=Streptomyces solicavernae TaxID=3043614 RepID=A0ABT6RK33_9ACTN|nr:hypothetical protein [Streptomyces sp. B-S-A8]MDI3384700.1 hypothetical protein [Streptomyces sp. B-S-A8]
MCAVTPLAVGLLYVTAAAATDRTLLPAALVLLAGAVVTARLVRVTSSAEPRERSRLPYKSFMLTQYGACLTQIAVELLV